MILIYFSRFCWEDIGRTSARNYLGPSKKGIVTDFTIHSIIIIMDGFKKLSELRIFLTSLTAYKGLQIYITTLSDEIRTVELATKHGLDMDNAIQYSTALGLRVDAIISFDKHFDNLEIPRREPADPLSK